MSPSLNKETYCHLTTYGRSSGKEHTVELSFYLQGNKVYCLSHLRPGDKPTDWVANLRVKPAGTLRIGDQTLTVTAFTEAPEQAEDIAKMFIEKYGQGFYDSWYMGTKRLAVVLEFRV